MQNRPVSSMEAWQADCRFTATSIDGGSIATGMTADATMPAGPSVALSCVVMIETGPGNRRIAKRRRSASVSGAMSGDAVVIDIV